ncbi:MAG: hypothetical protein ACOWYE_08875 [Desulfatiglandales bacterium]
MKAFKKELQTVVRDLKALALKTEKLTKKLGNLETAEAPKAKRGRPKLAPKTAVKRSSAGTAKESTAMDAVYGIISKTKKGVDTATIKEKTAFNDKKIWNAINRLKTQGKIKSARKGVYVKM